MKTHTLPLIAFLAALAAFVFLPVSATAASVALSVTGMISVLAADYGKDAKPLRVPAPVVPMDLSRMANPEDRAAA
jgi:hypothetical protein